MGTVRQQAAEQLRRLTTYHWAMLVISVLGFILGAFVSPYFLILLILPLFITPIARETGIIGGGESKIDFIAYQGSYVAFYLILLILVSVFIGKFISSQGKVEDLYLALLLIPIMYKFFSTLSLAYGGRTVGLVLGFVLGIILFLGSIIKGFEPDLFIISILTLLVCFVSFWLGKVGGSLLTLIGMAYFIILVNRWNEIDRAFGLSILIGAPLILAGLLIFFHRRIVLD